MLPAGVRIFLCTVPQDMRRSFDGLGLVVQQVLGEDPQSGELFVFVSKRATRVKVLWFDRNGYCLLYNQEASPGPVPDCRRRPGRRGRPCESTERRWGSCWPAWRSRNREEGLDDVTYSEYADGVNDPAPIDLTELQRRFAELEANGAKIASERDEYKRLYMATLELCRRLEKGLLGQKPARRARPLPRRRAAAHTQQLLRT